MVRLGKVSGFKISEKGQVETINYGDFLTITKDGRHVLAFREGLEIKDSSDFEQRIYTFVNEKLKELDYV